MVKKTYKRYSKKGGFLDEPINSIQNKLSEFGTKLSEGTSSLWRKSKEAIGLESPSYYVPSTSSTPSYGGRRTRRTRKSKRTRSMKRGGSTNSLTSMVNQPIDSAVSRINQPIQTLTSKVGGRRKSRRTRSRRSRR
jgi:hypothetical protein